MGSWRGGAYDLYCIAIVTFIFAAPPEWVGDPLHVPATTLTALWP